MRFEVEPLTRRDRIRSLFAWWRYSLACRLWCWRRGHTPYPNTTGGACRVCRGPADVTGIRREVG